MHELSLLQGRLACRFGLERTEQQRRGKRRRREKLSLLHCSAWRDRGKIREKLCVVLVAK